MASKKKGKGPGKTDNDSPETEGEVLHANFGNHWDEEDDPIDDMLLDDDPPFSDALITMPDGHVVKAFFCPACGAQLLGPKGLTPCPHLLFAMEATEYSILHADPRFDAMGDFLKNYPDEADEEPVEFLFQLIETKIDHPYSVVHFELEFAILPFYGHPTPLTLVIDFAARK